MSLSKEQILAAPDRPVARASVPEWGGDGHVFLREMSGKERDAYEVSVNDGERRNLDNMRARLVARCLSNENGERLFTDEEADALGAKSGRVLDRLFDEAASINGIGEHHVEELVGN